MVGEVMPGQLVSQVYSFIFAKCSSIEERTKPKCLSLWGVKKAIRCETWLITAFSFSWSCQYSYSCKSPVSTPGAAVSVI